MLYQDLDTDANIKDFIKNLPINKIKENLINYFSTKTIVEVIFKIKFLDWSTTYKATQKVIFKKYDE